MTTRPAYETILYEQDGPVVTLTWNRPQVLNAISEQLQEEFKSACRQADADPTCKVIVVKGAGRAFSAGYDVAAQVSEERAWPGGMPQSLDVGRFLDGKRGGIRDGWDGQIAFSEMDKPVIGQVHGWCIGGGTWYVLSMDIVIAADDATFGQPEVRNADACHFVWATRIGWSNALRYVLTGDHISAQEMYRMGGIQEVVPAADLDQRVKKLANRIALLPMESIKLNKAMIRKGMDAMGFRNAHAIGLELMTLVESSYTSVHRRWNDLARTGGTRAYLEARDGPFLPEPFGPRAGMTEWPKR